MSSANESDDAHSLSRKFFIHIFGQIFGIFTKKFYPQKLPGITKLEKMLTNILWKLFMEYSKIQFSSKMSDF